MLVCQQTSYLFHKKLFNTLFSICFCDMILIRDFGLTLFVEIFDIFLIFSGFCGTSSEIFTAVDLIYWSNIELLIVHYTKYLLATTVEVFFRL